MGMYTELVLGVDLKKDTPQNIIDALRYMLGEIDAEPALPAHDLFDTERWRFMLRCSSYYFAGPTISKLARDEMTKEWMLAVRTNLKNYDGEIEKFCDWLRPHISDPDAGEFMGYSRYEEAEHPTLLYV